MHFQNHTFIPGNGWRQQDSFCTKKGNIKQTHWGIVVIYVFKGGTLDVYNCADRKHKYIPLFSFITLYDSQLYLINLQLHIMLKHAEIKVKYTNAIKNLVRISH